MSIRFHEEYKTFYLTGKESSYIFSVNEQGFLTHLHYGKRIAEADLRYLIQGLDFANSPSVEDRQPSLNAIPQEYAIYGRGDYRSPSILIKTQSGSRLTEFRYQSHKIVTEKPAIKGMPSLRGGETLIVTLYDKINDLELDLYYTIYEEQSAVARRVVLKNKGSAPVSILKISSFSIDFARNDFDLISLPGEWAGERDIERQPLRRGVFEANSLRGHTSHQYNPFFALCDPSANEDLGECYGFNLAYSGSFTMKAESVSHGFTRVNGGINEVDFAWKLDVGEEFESPEAILVYSEKGLNKLSQNFHDLYREYFINPNFVFKKRPVLLNNWESTYFDFTEKTLCDLIEKAKGTGIDTFVLDDGWFGERNDDWAGLGDWTVNTKKLKGGLKTVIEKCKECGMKFGLWFEPEMVNENSDLHRAHPDWHIASPDLESCRGRHQWTLDFANPEVVEYIKGVMSDCLEKNEISYVKWDMNRPMSEFYSKALPADRQQETAHRYILGVYELAEYLTKKFPHVFFEGCAGGGGRFDPAMLHYFPQIWTSDNSDATARAYIQYGTSLCYPLSSMSGHISICPNHQTGRVTPIQSRMDMASFCATGYELNLHALQKQDFDKIFEHIRFYNGIHELVLRGDLYRLRSPFEGNYFSQMVVSKDKKKAVFVLMKIMAKANDSYPFIKLKGLDETTEYEIAGMGTFRGDVLMNVGLRFPKNLLDFETRCFVLNAVEK